WPDNDANLTGGVADLDDFSACRITRKQDWIDLYVAPFYFGCEADDRMNATAFSPHNPFGAKLNALYSSDIGHFDVIDMRDPLADPAALADAARLAEGLGYHSVFVADHVVMPRTLASAYPYSRDGGFPYDPDRDWLDPLVALGFLAGRTTTIRIGTSITVLPM